MSRPPPIRTIPRGKAEVLLWSEHLALLMKHAFPGSEKLLKAAKWIDADGDGDVLLRGSVAEVEELAGFVASEANHHARTGRRTQLAELWDEIAERFEAAL